jgi:predicted acyltransferase
MKNSSNQRLLSLDTLRGLDMAILVGISGIIETLASATDWNWLDTLEKQFHHVSWEGFRFYDLIFPLFMFVSGVAIPYAIRSKLEKGVPASLLLRKIFIRLVVLVVLGIIYNKALRDGFNDARYASVLAQIGFGYFFAALIFLYTKQIKKKVYWLLGIMAGVTILHLFVPVPGFGSGTFEKNTTINAWIDQLVLGGFDPEGILCMVSAIAITLMGAMAGYLIRSVKASQHKKALYLLISGAFLITFSLLVSPFYPIIKKMWTVTFIMLTGGISAILLAVFYYLIDIKGYKNWTLFFRVFGMNSITIYMANKIINFKGISSFFLGWTQIHISEKWGMVFIASGVFALQWALLYFLFKKKIFLRV